MSQFECEDGLFEMSQFECEDGLFEMSQFECEDGLFELSQFECGRPIICISMDSGRERKREYVYFLMSWK